MLHLFIDTSTWLDLAKRRDGQKWISTMLTLVLQSELSLLVPQVVIDEFERNRDKVETGMTTSVAQRFKLLKQDLTDFGGPDHEQAREFIDSLAHEVPLIGAMTTRNFKDVLELLHDGETLTPTAAEHAHIVQRGLDKRAPFHSGSNSVADALLIELYSTRISGVDLDNQPHAFVTSNSKDFSLTSGDKRQPHPDLADLFEREGSTYALGFDGLTSLLADLYGDALEDLLADSDFQDEPRQLTEIASAEQEFFDRVWYHRSLSFSNHNEPPADPEVVSQLLSMEETARRKVENIYTEEGQLGPYTDFELGMLNGKLSALRWVLGSEWDFLDT